MLVLSRLRVHLRTVGFLGNFALVENSVHHTGQLVLPPELHVLSVLVLKKLGSIKYIVYWPSTLFHHRKHRLSAVKIIKKIIFGAIIFSQTMHCEIAAEP